jgi:hypothetical protein
VGCGVGCGVDCGGVVVCGVVKVLRSVVWSGVVRGECCVVALVGPIVVWCVVGFGVAWSDLVVGVVLWSVKWWIVVRLIKADAKRFPYVDAPFLVGLSRFTSPDPAGVRL